MIWLRRGVALAANEQHSIALADGRTLGYAEYGDRRGAPALYFHGTPGSRIEGRFLDAAARRAGVRLVAVERPGYGLSRFRPRRTFLDWPDDVAQLADALALDRFGIVALSGGGPHAAACALRMSERLTFVAVVSGAVPIDLAVAAERGWLRRLFARAGAVLVRLTAPGFTAWMAFWAPRISARQMPRGVDPRVLASETAREMMRKDVVEAFRAGSRGAAHEFGLHTKRWPFRPAEVSMRMHLWHGEADRVVRVAPARLLAQAYADCRATFVAGGGHLMLFEMADEIFRVAVEASGPQ